MFVIRKASQKSNARNQSSLAKEKYFDIGSRQVYGDSIKEELMSPSNENEAPNDDYVDRRKSISQNRATFIVPNK